MYKRTVLRTAALKRVVGVIDELVPQATPRQKKRIANKILTLCDGKVAACGSLRIKHAT